jgi:hypothetical protein
MSLLGAHFTKKEARDKREIAAIFRLLQPADCERRLLQTIEWGNLPETLSRSIRAWDGLADDFKRLAEKG